MIAVVRKRPRQNELRERHAEALSLAPVGGETAIRTGEAPIARVVSTTIRW
jgi:hypothetical protein